MDFHAPENQRRSYFLYKKNDPIIHISDDIRGMHFFTLFLNRGRGGGHNIPLPLSV